MYSRCNCLFSFRLGVMMLASLSIIHYNLLLLILVSSQAQRWIDVTIIESRLIRKSTDHEDCVPTLAPWSISLIELSLVKVVTNFRSPNIKTRIRYKLITDNLTGLKGLDLKEEIVRSLFENLLTWLLQISTFLHISVTRK